MQHTNSTRAFACCHIIFFLFSVFFEMDITKNDFRDFFLDGYKNLTTAIQEEWNIRMKNDLEDNYNILSLFHYYSGTLLEKSLNLFPDFNVQLRKDPMDPNLKLYKPVQFLVTLPNSYLLASEKKKQTLLEIHLLSKNIYDLFHLQQQQQQPETNVDTDNTNLIYYAFIMSLDQKQTIETMLLFDFKIIKQLSLKNFSFLVEWIHKLYDKKLNYHYIFNINSICFMKFNALIDKSIHLNLISSGKVDPIATMDEKKDVINIFNPFLLTTNQKNFPYNSIVAKSDEVFEQIIKNFSLLTWSEKCVVTIIRTPEYPFFNYKYIQCCNQIDRIGNFLFDYEILPSTTSKEIKLDEKRHKFPPFSHSDIIISKCAESLKSWIDPINKNFDKFSDDQKIFYYDTLETICTVFAIVHNLIIHFGTKKSGTTMYKNVSTMYILFFSPFLIKFYVEALFRTYLNNIDPDLFFNLLPNSTWLSQSISVPFLLLDQLFFVPHLDHSYDQDPLDKGIWYRQSEIKQIFDKIEKEDVKNVTDVEPYLSRNKQSICMWKNKENKCIYILSFDQKTSTIRIKSEKGGIETIQEFLVKI